ncbi:HepT-like ribonuclease domain-containing protein [Selenomonas sp. FOBRC6]|uniref:HepT-like ribonuclease domain-containing protein n=1 Tax=Selenomonas sp. FOBRC6 TaxID=936572 RepID=UPI00056AEF5C|nr:HepT-like ribonuclease domain-containing protein [Selenomonas sp. FOBRC6]
MKLSSKDAQILQIIVQYCDDIISAIERFGATQEDFMQDRHYQHACSMALQTIGEVAKSFSNEFITTHTEVPWRLIKGMRNFFAHTYHSSIDMNAVWGMIHEDIPPLRTYCADLLKANNCEIIRIKPIPKK